MLGYTGRDELIGKNMHQMTHHSYPDGSVYPLEACMTLRSIRDAKGYVNSDEVFWKADGNSFFVEHRFYPQTRNGKVVGRVVSFLDISERKKREDEIRYQNFLDLLTMLHKRRYFEENRKSIHVPENLPLSVIYADTNVLKITNDIFGHAAGDELIREYAQIIELSCAGKDVITRMGGDEFLVLLTDTDKSASQETLMQIR